MKLNCSKWEREFILSDMPLWTADVKDIVKDKQRYFSGSPLSLEVQFTKKIVDDY